MHTKKKKESKHNTKISHKILKENQRGRDEKRPTKTDNKIAVRTHILIITLNLNGLNTSTKRLSKIKYKEKILKATREKQQITYMGIPIRLSGDFSAETMQARREWQDMFKAMKGKNLQPRLLYPARIAFRFNREIKSFTDKQKLRELISTTKPALQQMLKEHL